MPVIKRQTLAQMLFHEFWKNFQNTFLTNPSGKLLLEVWLNLEVRLKKHI